MASIPVRAGGSPRRTVASLLAALAVSGAVAGCSGSGSTPWPPQQAASGGAADRTTAGSSTSATATIGTLCDPDQPMSCLTRPVGGGPWQSPHAVLPNGTVTPEQYFEQYFGVQGAAAIANARTYYTNEGLTTIGHRQWEYPDGTGVDMLVLVYRTADGAHADAEGEEKLWDQGSGRVRQMIPGMDTVAFYRDYSLGPTSNLIDALSVVGRTELFVYYYPPGTRPANSADIQVLHRVLDPELRLLASQPDAGPSWAPDTPAGTAPALQPPPPS